MGKATAFKNEFTFGWFFPLIVHIYSDGFLLVDIDLRVYMVHRWETWRIEEYYCQVPRSSSCKFSLMSLLLFCISFILSCYFDWFIMRLLLWFSFCKHNFYSWDFCALSLFFSNLGAFRGLCLIWQIECAAIYLI